MTWGGRPDPTPEITVVETKAAFTKGKAVKKLSQLQR